MRSILLTLTIIILIASCKKDGIENFKQIIISGSVFDSSNRVGMVNVPVRVTWYGPGLQETAVDSTRTDAGGNYTVRTTIDILRFRNQSLDIEAVVPSGFISIHDLEHPTVGATILGYSEKFDLPLFVMYEKANLTINLERTSNDSFSDFQLYYNYGGRDYWVNIENNKPTGSIAYNVASATRVQTKVHWIKKYSSGTTTTLQDSVMILPNTINSLTVGY